MTQISNRSSQQSSKGLGIFQTTKDIYYYYRLGRPEGAVLQVLSSTDPLNVQTFHTYGTFKNRNGENRTIDGVESFRISELGSVYALTYKDKSNTSDELQLALSKDLQSFTSITNIKGIKETGMIIPNHYDSKSFVMVYGEHDLRIATSDDVLTWKIREEPIVHAIQDHFGTLSLIVGAVIPLDVGYAVLYYARGIGGSHWSIHGIILDKKNPSHVLWEADTLWELHNGWEEKHVSPLGMIYRNNQLYSYWDFESEGIFAMEHPAFSGMIHKKASFANLQLNRMEQNPVIKPNSENFWESKQVFNAAAVYEQGKVHLVYRAIGDYDTSVLGYASSEDGVHFDDKHPDPIYIPTQPFEMPQGGIPWFASGPGNLVKSPYESGGGGYGGCEDPRLTKIEDRYYMTYIAYDAANPPRVALSSISVSDFHNKNWNWETPVLISPPGVVDKNCVIFPEKINGKYAIMHRIYPNILVDYVDHLRFDGETFLRGEYKIKPSRMLWDSRKVGAGPPPLKTKYGWLLIYHAVGEKDSGRYKIGAMLLDLKDPTKVIARSIVPILSPDHPHDNEGFKSGVVYPCGAIVKDDQLIVYYGGADTVVCGASTNLESFLNELMVTGSTTTKPIYIPKLQFAFATEE